MTRDEIAAVLKRHHGSKSLVALRAAVAQNAVSMWLAGGTNANVAKHAEAVAQELLDREQGIDGRPVVRAKLSELRGNSSSSSKGESHD